MDGLQSIWGLHVERRLSCSCANASDTPSNNIVQLIECGIVSSPANAAIGLEIAYKYHNRAIILIGAHE